MVKKISHYFKQFVAHEKSAQKLALSFCIGNYIAFSPFLALHTVMIFLSVWLFGLNPAVTFAVAYGVNNPWTAIPIYTIDYFFGYSILHWLLHIDTAYYTPGWVNIISNFCEQRLGIATPCFWSFFIGGNLLGFLTSLILYPFIKRIFQRFIFQMHGVYG